MPACYCSTLIISFGAFFCGWWVVVEGFPGSLPGVLFCVYNALPLIVLTLQDERC